MTQAETHGAPGAEDRFDRLRRIEWWDQERLARARVLVIGAGALGNEILKNLALLGVGHVMIADLDTIEESNLSRSVLFRDADTARSKAEVAAQAVRDLYPQARVGWFHGDVIYEFGLGAYRWADVVIAGLDNREARLHANRACYQVGRPLVDAATEVLRGVARVFVPPHGACYECTMSAADWEVLKERRGCAGMRAQVTSGGRVPTTPVTASLIGALQCQEAVKVLHGIPGLVGEGVVFDGMINDLYRVRYPRSEECNSHEPFDDVVALDRRVDQTDVGTLLQLARQRLGETAVLELRHEILQDLGCARCQTAEQVWRPLGSVAESRARCPTCGEMRRANTARIIDERSAFLKRTLAEIGVPPFDIIAARAGLTTIGFEFSSDGSQVLGEALGSADAAAPVGEQHATRRG